MKKIIISAASFVFLAFGAQVQARELLDNNRFMASMEDSYKNQTYGNIHKLESFVAALEDNREGHYRNIHNETSFVAALGDNFKGYTYRNMHNYESFVAALKDSREGNYRNIHNGASFVAALEDSHAAKRHPAYSPVCMAEATDLLSDSGALSKLAEGCK